MCGRINRANVPKETIIPRKNGTPFKIETQSNTLPHDHNGEGTIHDLFDRGQAFENLMLQAFALQIIEGFRILHVLVVQDVLVEFRTIERINE